jgi:hypothetical protein
MILFFDDSSSSKEYKKKMTIGQYGIVRVRAEKLKPGELGIHNWENIGNIRVFSFSLKRRFSIMNHE